MGAKTAEDTAHKSQTQVCCFSLDSDHSIYIASQASAQLQLFMENISSIQEYIISHDADMSVGEDCPCGRLDSSGTRTKATVKCTDCSFSAPACSLCFIDEHVARYTHWANVWNDQIGCYARQDISCLGYVINLGHGGEPCPHTIPNSDLFFHIVDINGVHDTKVRFCGCLPQVDRAFQLLQHQLFPATMSRPKMAFTFQLLDFYNILHVEGKISAYDFIGSIRRTTDNVFTHNVTVSNHSSGESLKFNQFVS